MQFCSFHASVWVIFIDFHRSPSGKFGFYGPVSSKREELLGKYICHPYCAGKFTIMFYLFLNDATMFFQNVASSFSS